MPGQPLLFYRNIPIEQQSAISITELQQTQLACLGDRTRVADFCRDYSLSTNEFDEVASPTVRQDMVRTPRVYIRSGRKIYANILGKDSRDPIDGKSFTEQVIAKLTALTDHPATRALLLTMLGQAGMKATKHTEVTTFYGAGISSDHKCGVVNEQFLQPKAVETGYFIYDNTMGVTVIDVQAVYGCTERTAAGIFSAEIPRGAHPEIIYLTYYHLKRNGNMVSVHADDYTLMYSPLSNYSASLLLRFSEQVLGGRQPLEGEPAIIREMQAADRPFIHAGAPALNAPENNGSCCDRQKRAEETYLSGLKKFCDAMVSCNVLQCLAHHITTFLDQSPQAISNTQESRFYEKFKTEFVDAEEPAEKLRLFLVYLKAKKVIEPGLFFPRYDDNPLPLPENSAQRNLLGFLSKHPLLMSLFPQQDDMAVQNEEYWLGARASLITGICDICRQHGEMIGTIMKRHSQLVHYEKLTVGEVLMARLA